jgi:nitrate reductase delta subunit
MIQTYNILSLLLDYPTAELWDSRADILPALRAEGVLSEALLSKVETFLGYVASFADARSWQAAYSDLFDTQTKTNLYLFDMVYGTSRDRGQAMVDLKEEYLKAGLMPAEDELPDYLPMYLQYVANMDDLAQARAAIDDIRGVLTKMDDRFAKEQHPYEPLIALLKES